MTGVLAGASNDVLRQELVPLLRQMHVITVSVLLERGAFVRNV